MTGMPAVGRCFLQRAVLFVWLVSGVAHADTDEHAWSLDEVVRMATERAPEVRRARAALATAEAHRAFGRVSRAGNPQVTARALIGVPDDPAATYALSIGVPIDLANAPGAYRREAGHRIDEARAWLAVSELRARVASQEAFVEVDTAKRRFGVSLQTAATWRELLGRLRARLDAGAATALDLALAETQLARAEADAARARRVVVEAEGQLRSTLDLPASTELRLAPLPPLARPVDLSMEERASRALTHRKELDAWSSQAARWSAADARLRAEAVAPLTVALDGERQGNTQPNSSVGGSVGFELPFIQKNQGARAVARGERAAAQLERTLTEREIAREVARATRQLEAALAELSALETSALPASARAIELLETLLEAGSVDSLRLLTAREQAYDLRLRHVDSLRAAWRSRLALDRAIGEIERGGTRTSHGGEQR